MTTTQLIKIFSKPKGKVELYETTALADIMKYVNVNSGISPNGIDYYCEIGLLELSKSNIPEETLFEMANSGWMLSKDRKKIIFKY